MQATVQTALPAVDIQELPTSYVLRLDMPGVEKEAIKAHVNERVLDCLRNGSCSLQTECYTIV